MSGYKVGQGFLFVSLINPSIIIIFLCFIYLKYLFPNKEVNV